jgi:hypothetical protein
MTTSVGGMSVTDDLERTRKEAVLAYFMVSSYHWTGRTENNHDTCEMERLDYGLTVIRLVSVYFCTS